MQILKSSLIVLSVKALERRLDLWHKGHTDTCFIFYKNVENCPQADNYSYFSFVPNNEPIVFKVEFSASYSCKRKSVYCTTVVQHLVINNTN